MDTLIIDKLRKIEKLANCGIDGERKNAARMLQDLLSRHGLTLEDLSEENKEGYRITYRTVWEKKLLFQIYAKVTGSSRITYSKYKGQMGMFFKLTMPPDKDAEKKECNQEESERIWRMIMGLRDVVVLNKTKLIEENRV